MTLHLAAPVLDQVVREVDRRGDTGEPGMHSEQRILPPLDDELAIDDAGDQGLTVACSGVSGAISWQVTRDGTTGHIIDSIRLSADRGPR